MPPVKAPISAESKRARTMLAYLSRRDRISTPEQRHAAAQEFAYCRTIDWITALTRDVRFTPRQARALTQRIQELTEK